MPAKNYWLDLFTGTTWREFLDAGGTVSGFPENRWNTLKRVKPGDYLLCYVTGIMRFIATLEVASEPYKDTSPIWQNDPFPCRVKVSIIASLTPETGSAHLAS